METEELSDQDRDFFERIRNGDVKAICVFIEKSEKAPFDNENNESAAAVALKSKQLSVYEALISRGWCLNSNENYNEIVNELEKVLRRELLQILKEFVKNPDDDHLKTLIDTFLDQNRYILFNNVDEGKLLLADNIKSRRKKNIEKIIEQFHEALKCELREIHTRNFIKNPNEEHLTALITRTSIYFGGSSATTNRPKYLKLIAGAYEQLNEVKEIRTIFKVVANVKNLDIIFDFNHDSVEHADATGNENVYGKSYAETGRVYLGAKALNEPNRSEQLSEDNSETVDLNDDDKPSRPEVLGVLAHELCHVAIFRIYNNNFKPYHKEDSEGLAEFKRAFEHCRENSYYELIIALALNGPEDVVHDELIVRVPHLLALYQGDNEKIKSLRETFKKLFDYFEVKTLQDLEREIELMKAVWKLKSKEPQHLTDSKIFIKPTSFEIDLDSNKVFEIFSNCPEMTMNWIFQKTTSKPIANSLFLDLKHLKDEETFELMIDAHSSCMKPIIVIDCDNETEKEIKKIAEEMKNNEITERIIFVHNHKESLIKDATFLETSHSWLDLMDQSKENLITRTITFQGEKIVLEDIVDFHCDALDFVPLKELLDNYLKIGNEIKFPEIDIHVQRKFLNTKCEEIYPIQLLNIAETSKFILLSDDPGMGKTTELKMLTMEFKKKFKSFWVAFVDLKEHSEFYEKDEKFKTEFSSPKEVANFFSKKIFKLNEFEEKLFEHLFVLGRVVVLLDGFDEISPSFKKFVIMLIKSIKSHSRNILVTSTRHHLKKELCRKLEVEAFTLMPLTDENCDEILKKNFEIKGITEEDLKKKIDDTKEFFEKLNKNLEPVRNPLILQMVAKVFSNNKVAQVTQPNIYSIYENFVKIMIRESMKRGDDARDEAASCLMSDFNIIKFYQKEAFKLLFDYDEQAKRAFNDGNHQIKNCFMYCFSEVQSLPNEQITRVALMKSDGSGKFQFIHRTFAEFFVAEFLFKSAFDLKIPAQKFFASSQRLKYIYEVICSLFVSSSLYKPVRTFIDEASENLIANIEEIDRKKMISKFHEIFWENEMPKFFLKFASHSLLNLITVISRCAEKKELKRLWTYKDKNGTNVFMIAAETSSLYFNKKLTELAREVLREVLDEKDFLNFFTEKTKSGDTVVQFALKSGNSDVLNFYLNFSTSLDQPPEHFEIKVKLIKLLRSKEISKFREELEDVEEKRSLKYLQRLLNSRTIERETFYCHASRFLSTLEEFEKLWNFLRRVLGENGFKIILKKPSLKLGVTPLMIKAWNCKKEIFIPFWKLLTEGLTNEEKEKLLNEKDKTGNNLFDFATRNKDPETFLAIKDLYMETFEEDKIKIMLMRERDFKESILVLPLRCRDDNVATVKALWTFIQEIFDVPTQKTILMKKNENRETFYWKIINRQDFNERMEIFEPFIEKHLTKREKEDFKYENVVKFQNFDAIVLRLSDLISLIISTVLIVGLIYFIYRTYLDYLEASL